MLLTLCKEDGKAELSKLQTCFQPNMGCMMTAFMVRESMHYTAEFGSKLYTIVKGLSNLKPFRIKIILKRILLKDETKNI